MSPCLKFPPQFCLAKWLAKAQPIGPDGTFVTQLSSLYFARLCTSMLQDEPWLFGGEKRPWPLSPSWGKPQASGTVQRIGLCTQQEFSWCWHWIDGQINCWKCIEKIHTLSTLMCPIFNIIPMKNFIGTYPTDFHQFFQTLANSLPLSLDFLHFFNCKIVIPTFYQLNHICKLYVG